MSHLPARKTISELHSNSDTTYKDQQARSCSNRSFWREELASWLWACSQPSASSCQLPPGQLQGRKPPHRSHGLAETPEPGEPVRRGQDGPGFRLMASALRVILIPQVSWAGQGFAGHTSHSWGVARPVLLLPLPLMGVDPQ